MPDRLLATFAFLFAAAVVGPLAGCSMWPSKSDKASDEFTNTVSLSAVVESVDPVTREITFEGQDGEARTFLVSDEVRNLDQVEPGDTVEIKYTEAIAYRVVAADDAESTVAESTASIDRAKPGEKPGGSVSQATTITTKILAIDKAAQTVTLEWPGVGSRTIKARNPENLDKVAVGDAVRITYTEAVAVSVKPTPKPKS